MQKIIIYQLLVRLFGNTTTKCTVNGRRSRNGVGTFNDISNTALREIKKLGITHIWYTGIIEHMIAEGYKRLKIKGNNLNIIKGLAGSPFAIKDYYDVNPDLANNPKKRMKEWEKLVERTHANGLKLIIDFVPNHVAREYHSDQRRAEVNDFGMEDNPEEAFSNQNDYYYLPNRELVLPLNSGTKHHRLPSKQYVEIPAKATGNDKFSPILNLNDWYDTVKLNYGVNYFNGKGKNFEPLPAVWQKMLDILLFWCGKGVDGFRCDMVDMIPLEFWEWVVPQIKEKYPDVIFIAEAYQPHLFKKYIETGCFDMLYDKVITYDTLRKVLQHNETATSLAECWKKLDGINDKMLKFLENHDEQRIASTYFLGNPFIAIPGMIYLATGSNSPLMLYFGQEVGEPAKGVSGYSRNDGKTTIYDYWHVPEHQKWMNKGRFNENKISENQKKLRRFYTRLFHICQSCNAFSQGNFYDLTWANQHDNYNAEKIYTYLRYTESKRYLIVLNFDKKNRQKPTVFISEHAFSCMKIGLSAKFIISSLLGKPINMQKNSAENIVNYGLEIELLPHSGTILEFKFRL